MKNTLSLDWKAKENSVSQDHTAIEEQSGQDLHYLPFYQNIFDILCIQNGHVCLLAVTDNLCKQFEHQSLSRHSDSVL